ncbi:hypothetical protein ACVIGA_000786 [Bradyrhizobium sp. USDA 3240]
MTRNTRATRSASKNIVPPSTSAVQFPDRAPAALPDDSTSPPDQWVAEQDVCAELSLTSMSFWRYDRDQKMMELGWPPAIRLNGRIYRSRRALDLFKTNMAMLALREREALLRAVERKAAQQQTA